jgi:hypothetical protein
LRAAAAFFAAGFFAVTRLRTVVFVLVVFRLADGLRVAVRFRAVAARGRDDFVPIAIPDSSK